MSSFLFHVIVDMTGNELSIPDEARSDQWQATYYYDYQMRSTPYTFDKYPWSGLWPKSCNMSGAGSQSTFVFGQDNCDYGGSFEPWMLHSGGTNRPWFITGFVYLSGVPLQGAVMSAFLTSNNAFAGSAASNPDGSYAIPVYYPPGTNFYVVSNYGPNIYTGASVNNVQSAS